MTSRLTAFAAAFACIATTTIGWAASTSQADNGVTSSTRTTRTARDGSPIVRLDTIVIIGHRAATTVR